MIQSHATTVQTWLIRGSVILAVLFVAIEVIATNQFAGSGREVSQLDAHIERLTQENGALEQSLASASSLLTIASKAKELGFIEPMKSQFISVGANQLPVALGLSR